jgi:hypothetical protein
MTSSFVGEFNRGSEAETEGRSQPGKIVEVKDGLKLKAFPAERCNPGWLFHSIIL